MLSDNKIDQLHKDVQEKSEKVEKLQSRLMAKELEAQKDLQVLKSELAEQRHNFEEKLDKVRLDLRNEAEAVIKEHQDKVEDLKVAHATEKDKLQRNQEYTIRNLKKDHENKIEAMALDYENKTNALQDDFKTVIYNMSMKQEEEITNLEKVLGETKLHVEHFRKEVYDKDDTIASLQNKYSEKVTDLEGQLSKAVNEAKNMAKEKAEKENIVEDLLDKVDDIKHAHEAEKLKHANESEVSSRRIENLRGKVKALAAALGSEQVVTEERSKQVEDMKAERDKLEQGTFVDCPAFVTLSTDDVYAQRFS